jgi:hypothetical protein
MSGVPTAGSVEGICSGFEVAVALTVIEPETLGDVVLAMPED